MPAVATSTCPYCQSQNPVSSLTCHTCGSSLGVANNAPLAPGTTLKHGQYRLLEVLGQGGFGITYKAIRNTTGRYCALKEFFPASSVTRTPDGQVTPDASFKDDFERGKLGFHDEAARLASFRHASIVSVIETFQEHGVPGDGVPGRRNARATHCVRAVAE